MAHHMVHCIRSCRKIEPGYDRVSILTVNITQRYRKYCCLAESNMTMMIHDELVSGPHLAIVHLPLDVDAPETIYDYSTQPRSHRCVVVQERCVGHAREITRGLEKAVILKMDILLIRYDIVYLDEPEKKHEGASESMLSRLEKVKIDDNCVGERCVVCFDDLLIEDIETITRMPDCRHVFHEPCILRWLEKKNSCPLCRSKLVDLQVSSTTISV